MHTSADAQSIKMRIEHRTALLYHGGTTTSQPHSTTVLGCPHGLLKSFYLRCLIRDNVLLLLIPKHEGNFLVLAQTNSNPDEHTCSLAAYMHVHVHAYAPVLAHPYYPMHTLQYVQYVL